VQVAAAAAIVLSKKTSEVKPSGSWCCDMCAVRNAPWTALNRERCHLGRPWYCTHTDIIRWRRQKPSAVPDNLGRACHTHVQPAVPEIHLHQTC
jgi:hypothetical protein